LEKYRYQVKFEINQDWNGIFEMFKGRNIISMRREIQIKEKQNNQN